MEKEVLKKYFNEEVGFKRVKYDYDVNYKAYPELFEALNSIKNKNVLSLGCGTGREIKFLVKNKNKVVGVDFAENVIKSSKKIEPNAKYYCMDAVGYLDNQKYDYILGLNGFFNYITTKEKRKRLAENMKQMLKENGEIRIGLNLINLKDKFKLIVTPIIALILGEYSDYSFGDIYYRKPNDEGEKVYFVKTHLYTKKELKRLFKNMEFEFIKKRDWNYIIKIK